MSAQADQRDPEGERKGERLFQNPKQRAGSYEAPSLYAELGFRGRLSQVIFGRDFDDSKFWNTLEVSRSARLSCC